MDARSVVNIAAGIVLALVSLAIVSALLRKA